MKITEKTIKALKILDLPIEKGLTAREFAQQMWADSEAWLNVRNTGNGACAGKGMWLCAGSYLAKLKKADLITHCYYLMESSYQNIWRISAQGQEILLREQESKAYLQKQGI